MKKGTAGWNEETRRELSLLRDAVESFLLRSREMFEVVMKFIDCFYNSEHLEKISPGEIKQMNIWRAKAPSSLKDIIERLERIVKMKEMIGVIDPDEYFDKLKENSLGVELMTREALKIKGMIEDFIDKQGFSFPGMGEGKC